MADLLTNLPAVQASSDQEWQFQIFTVQALLGRSSGRSIPQLSIDPLNTTTPIDQSVDMYYLILADQGAELPSTLQPSIDPLNTTTPHKLICTTSYWQIKRQIP